MPKIEIKEVDNTGERKPEYNDYVVLVPGADKFGNAKITTALFDSVDTFVEAVPVAKEATPSEGWKITKLLLSQGMKVQYVSYEAGHLKEIFKQFTDKGKYDLRFITTGGASKEELTAEVCREAVWCAAERGDAVALIDYASGETGASEIEAEKHAASIFDSKQSEDLTKDHFINSLGEPVSKYAADTGTWVTLKDLNVRVPGSVHHLLCFNESIKRYPDWFAAAGAQRGVCPLTVESADLEFGDAEINYLQSRTYDASKGDFYAINPIAQIRPYGYLYFGNRTMFPLTAENPELVASSFLNIRHLAIDIKKKLYRVCRQFTFEPNSDVLWVNFQNAIKPLLEEMRTAQGIRGYRLIKEKTSEKATLKALIQIVPIEAVEDFKLTVELTDSISSDSVIVTEGV